MNRFHIISASLFKGTVVLLGIPAVLLLAIPALLIFLVFSGGWDNGSTGGGFVISDFGVKIVAAVGLGVVILLLCAIGRQMARRRRNLMSRVDP